MFTCAKLAGKQGRRLPDCLPDCLLECFRRQAFAGRHLAGREVFLIEVQV